jgi:molybdenum cofactor cytidylyltransferase
VIVPIVLAAGESTRMGAPKALLPDGAGRVFITRLLHTFSQAGFSGIAVVTGALHERIVAAVAADAPPRMSIAFARNPHPERGQLSSLLVGLNVVARPGVRAVLVTLVDVPFVEAATIQAVVDAYEQSRARIVRPARGGRHGHPVLFDAPLFAELRRADHSHGAKSVVHAHSAEVVNVQTTDGGAFLDIDTPAEYDKVLRP